MTKQIQSVTIVTLQQGQIRFMPYMNQATKTVCGFFFIRNSGIFLSCGISMDLHIKLMMRKEEMLKPDSTLDIGSVGVDDENKLFSIGGKDEPLDWMEIILSLNENEQQKLLGNGMFFPFREVGITATKKNEELSFSPVELCDGIENMEKMRSGLESNWEQTITHFVTTNQLMKFMKSGDGVEVMWTPGCGLFKVRDTLSVKTFIDTYLVRMGSFRKFIKMNEKMSIEDAVAELAKFHKVTKKRILDVFSNLRWAQDSPGSTATFDESVSVGASCIGIECNDKNGKWLSSTLIDEYTGNSIPHVS